MSPRARSGSRSNGRAITFDFHNTLAACPEWFELEVRHLPSAFLRWWGQERGNPLPAVDLDQADAHYRDLRRDIMEHGVELTAEACLVQVFALMGLDVPMHDIARGVERVMREALASATPIPGAVEVVGALAAARVPLGVVSSAVYHPFLEWTLDSFGMLQGFRVIVTSASAGFYKSRPEIYWHAAEALGTPPERMVHVGDSLRYDVGGAARAGMGTVWLQRAREESPDDHLTPDLTIVTLESAAPAILELLHARDAADDGALK